MWRRTPDRAPFGRPAKTAPPSANFPLRFDAGLIPFYGIRQTD
jgi:hypothetical protein